MLVSVPTLLAYLNHSQVALLSYLSPTVSSTCWNDSACRSLYFDLFYHQCRYYLMDSVPYREDPFGHRLNYVVGTVDGMKDKRLTLLVWMPLMHNNSRWSTNEESCKMLTKLALSENLLLTQITYPLYISPPTKTPRRKIPCGWSTMNRVWTTDQSSGTTMHSEIMSRALWFNNSLNFQHIIINIKYNRVIDIFLNFGFANSKCKTKKETKR